MFTAHYGLNSFNMARVNLGLYRLRRSVTGLSPRRIGFYARSFNVALEQVPLPQ